MTLLETCGSLWSSTLWATLPAGKMNTSFVKVLESASKRGFRVKDSSRCSFSETHLEDREQFPSIVHMILTFVVKKEPKTKK